MNTSLPILVVDDEKSIVFALCRYFSQQGHPVDCASSAEEALDLLGHQQYALAIVDVNLRGSEDFGDGLNLAAFIRQHAPDTVVIVLTALESRETEERAHQVGVHSFMRKPAALAHLSSVASGLMRSHAAAQ